MSKVTVWQTGYHTSEEVAHVFEGNYDVAVQPEGVLVVLESVPDVSGKSEDGNVKRVRAVFSYYSRVMVD